MREKLLKFLMLTTSENDGEALNAIRMANKRLKKEGVEWKDLIKIDGVGATQQSFASLSQLQIRKFLIRKLMSPNPEERFLAGLLFSMPSFDDRAIRKMDKMWKLK